MAVLTGRLAQCHYCIRDTPGKKSTDRRSNNTQLFNLSTSPTDLSSCVIFSYEFYELY